MATIKIKRGNSANLGSLVLQSGELAVALDTGKVYIGDGDGNKILVNPDVSLAEISGAGSAAAKNVGTAAGDVPVLGAGGKLDAATLPAIAISDTFVVNSQTAMLALTAETGDIAVRTDLNKSFILKTMPATALANWQELLTPTDAVTSVNGMNGAVTVSTISGNAGTATALQTARTISISGGATGTATSFNGSADITIPITALDIGKATAGTLPVARGGTGAATLTGIVKGNGTGAMTAATAGTDYVVPSGSITGNAGTADKLKTARTISLTGDVSGSVSFDGSANASITTTVDTIDGGTF